ncbi:hypothetical protein [Kitasatospora aureofaciens]
MRRKVQTAGPGIFRVSLFAGETISSLVGRVAALYGLGDADAGFS